MGAVVMKKDDSGQGTAATVSTSIWRDPWIPGVHINNLQPASDVATTLEKVSELLTEDGRSWDRQKLMVAFDRETWEKIMRIPLNRTSCRDVRWRHASTTSLTVRLCSLRASCALNSANYGGWDDLRNDGASEGPGESDVFRNLVISLGLDDRKSIFVFLLGLVCAMAISRVRVSSIVLLPASVLVFATGFMVGIFRNAITFGDVRINGSKRRSRDENLNLFGEKLRSLVKFFDEVDFKVNNLKSDLQNAIRSNKIKVEDLDGYVLVTDSIKLSTLNARNVVKTLIESEENSNGVLAEKHKSGRRKKEVGETGSNSAKVRENVKLETPEKELDQTRGNSSTPLVKDDYKANSNLGSSHDSPSTSLLDVDGNERTKATSEKEIFDLDEDRSTRRIPDNKEYNYQNNRLRFSNNHSFSLKMDSNRITDVWESNDNLLDSENLNVRMKQVERESSFVHEQMFNRAHETYRSSHKKREKGSFRSQYTEDRENNGNHHDLANDLFAHESELNTSSTSKISDDVVFDRYLAEATDLLKQAKEFIKGRHDEDHAEVMLYKSANLLSKAVDLKPMSLLAVGQLGNTYLLHGELKLKSSRDLRTLLSGRINSSSGKHSRVLKRLQNKITSKEEVAPLLIDVCEECEELLVEAGRKYKLALSIDGNDAAAFEADRVYLAAIDKFDAMMSKGNVYAPDALFRWGVALQQRSRLRPPSSREKVKLLQQAKRLYEDALYMDSNNIQVKDALSTCISELNYRLL
ncbi:putative transmembrane protein [Senna tora]|uniref:Putative transmembrane protein n=1 Tax=Senna tora TaxID=362788 RepID=A0A834X5X0_9FABA|nr:putative transmembrane protein [Senna tora]